MKILNTLLLSAMLTLVTAPVAFGCPCNKNVSNEAFLESVRQTPDYRETEGLTP